MEIKNLLPKDSPLRVYSELVEIGRLFQEHPWGD
jgi:hypothetical protein